MSHDTVNEAHLSANRLREHIMHELLRVGALVRQDEQGRITPEKALLDTIKANVGNDHLTDAEFRQFIRNSVAT